MGEVGGAGEEEQWEGSSIAHMALLYGVTGPELPAVNYSFSVINIRFL